MMYTLTRGPFTLAQLDLNPTLCECKHAIQKHNLRIIYIYSRAISIAMGLEALVQTHTHTQVESSGIDLSII